ncbi:hypothetical protein CAPTEDRAFT_202712, partial [Capitella teleta]
MNKMRLEDELLTEKKRSVVELMAIRNEMEKLKTELLTKHDEHQKSVEKLIADLRLKMEVSNGETLLWFDDEMAEMKTEFEEVKKQVRKSKLTWGASTPVPHYSDEAQEEEDDLDYIPVDEESEDDDEEDEVIDLNSLGLDVIFDCERVEADPKETAADERSPGDIVASYVRMLSPIDVERVFGFDCHEFDINGREGTTVSLPSIGTDIM